MQTPEIGLDDYVPHTLNNFGRSVGVSDRSKVNLEFTIRSSGESLVYTAECMIEIFRYTGIVVGFVSIMWHIMA